jgi:1-deoxy-D-xylulose-5-phosphate synthase
MPLLDRIHKPSDVKNLSLDDLGVLAGELRERIVQAVSANGGHLASNLGVVELTIALHYVYDFGPYPAGPDRLLLDVGHQCYPHKMLTGRAKDFDQLRKKGHVGGFPMPDESPYDLFAVGHAGTAISTAVGMARGDAALKRKNHVVAVVGDASIVNGLAFEGLNNAGTVKRQLLVILNDNGMSISKPQGAFSHYLERVRVSSTYDEAKKIAQSIVGKLPSTVGNTIEHVWHFTKEAVKHTVWPGQIFETLGMKYMGPIDGHDLPTLIEQLSEIKDHDRPVLLHVRTLKGCGYEHAINEPTKFHSPASFKVIDADTETCGCRVEIKSGGRNWTTAFAEACIELAKKDPKLVALTAAMPDGTGLSKFEKVFPDRYYDTGICESHLIAMAAGMAKAGLKPIAAIYSTFMQRAFDQVWQEVVLNHLPVVLAMDRAGFVGDDGAVHHGFCDISFLRPLPGIVLMAPSDEAELKRCLALATTLETASALRYPRDTVPTTNFEDRLDNPGLRAGATSAWTLGKSRTLREGDDATIVAYGAMVGNALEAALELAESDGLSVGVVDARFCKPLDGEMLARVLRPGHAVVTVEDHSLQNGFGSAVLEYAQSHRLPVDHLTRLGIPDRLIEHAARPQQLAEVGLDVAGIARSVRDAVRATREADARREAEVLRT